MASDSNLKIVTVREHECIVAALKKEIVDPTLRKKALDGIEEIHKKHIEEGNPSLFIRREGGLRTRNYVGALGVENVVIEILPKVLLDDKDKNEVDEIKETRDCFLEMLSHWRGLKECMPHGTAAIKKWKNNDMLEVFFGIFIDQLIALTHRGLAHHYHAKQDNLYHITGRLKFPEHLLFNLFDRTRFYVEFDEFSPNRPANRLIHSTINKLLGVTRSAEIRRKLRQLKPSFEHVPVSKNYHADWQKHVVDRNMQHYRPVMQWVRLFLFGHGLATFSGKHENVCLLFPMERVFEDFVAHSFQKHAPPQYNTRFQMSERKMLVENSKYKMRPDIILKSEDGGALMTLDTKWKEVQKVDSDVDESDMYQLYAYGRFYNCRNVALIYPCSENFNTNIGRNFDDAQDPRMRMHFLPFDCAHPEKSVEGIVEHLEGVRPAH